MAIHFILGGARSGKTSYTEAQALSQADKLGLCAVYVATGVATDDEMKRRIDLHRIERCARYRTVEVPRELMQWVSAAATRGGEGVLVIDCLATYLGTALFDAGEQVQEADLLDAGERLIRALIAYPHPVWVVSNEVGMGIVPAYASARLYRDVLGRWNRLFAEAAGDVTLLVAGLPWPLKRGGQTCAPVVG